VREVDCVIWPGVDGDGIANDGRLFQRHRPIADECDTMSNFAYRI
jgi:hypothetical protein